MGDDLVGLVLRCTREVAEQEGVVLPGEASEETVLFGAEGVFDSLALVNLVLSVEEAVERERGIAITLADERAMSQSTSPFRSVGSLAAYAERLVEEGG